jgi:hypothetical protein
LQLFLLLAAKGLAAPTREDGRLYYLLDQLMHQHLVELLSVRSLSLQAAPHLASG